MSKGINKKLTRAREVCRQAGYLLAEIQASHGNEFCETTSKRVSRVVNECFQQSTALFDFVNNHDKVLSRKGE